MELNDRFADMIKWLRVEAFEVNQSVLLVKMGNADRDFARSRSTMFSLAADLIEHSLKSVSDLQAMLKEGQKLMQDGQVVMKTAIDRADLAQSLLEDVRPIIEAHADGVSTPELKSYAQMLRDRLDALLGTEAKGV
jgi:hypothetical protein